MTDAMLMEDQSSSDTAQMTLMQAVKVISNCLAVQTRLEVVLDGAGWQNHPVCTRKYHFIIPVRASQDTALAHGNIPALVEIWLQGSSKKPLLLPQYLSDDASSPFVAPISIFDSTSHVLHGVLHANGFGHLVRINGLEGGSEHVTGGLLCILCILVMGMILIAVLLCCLLHGGKAAVRGAHHHWTVAPTCAHA